ncbi:MAG: 50S ribosomal protein L21 [Pseudomonadota bacterium]
MFAVIKTGGKQYKVAEGDEIVVEKLIGDAGEDVTFGDVLMLGEGGDVKVGAPTVSGASVVGEIAEQRKGEKVMIFKKRQRNTYRRKKGHRQLETVVKITSILADGKKAPAKKKAAPKKEEPKKEAPKTEAPKAEAKPAPAKADTAAMDSRGRLSGPQGEADDLKKIKGVGKVLEGKLNDAGIYHFWQVAALKADQITELEEEMSFPGRIERDNWVEQASELAKEA